MYRSTSWLTAIALAGACSAPLLGGVTVYEEGEKKIEIGGRIQAQYLYLDPDSGASLDELFFRRLRPYVAGTVSEDWFGKIQFDFGESEGSDEVRVMDAYARYLGVKNHHITIGNSKTPFSREFLTSSRYQQLVERTFVGDHNFGAPDRQLGVRLDGHNDSKKLTWAAAVGSESHDPAINRMDFDTPVNRDSDWNEGWVYAARLDVHPRGQVKFSQTDFHTDEWKYNFSGAAFAWQNDDDNNTFTDDTGSTTQDGIDDGKVDLDSANGFELSAGVRGKGLSVDVEYQMIHGETVDTAFTGGLYLDGETDLDKLAIEGGYLLRAVPVEFVVGWESQDADNYETQWERTSVGVNWYWNGHNAKWQNEFRMSDNVAGVDGVELNAFISQLQFLF